MKNPKGSFHYGSGLTYYTGSCTNGTGLIGGSRSGTCSMHCFNGTVISVSSCNDTSNCSNHGGAQNCNGTSGSECLN